MKKMIYLLSQY